MIYQIVDWAATYIECFVLLAAIAQISGKKLAGIKHILLLCLFSLTDCILVATLNSIQSFSFLDSYCINIILLFCIGRFLYRKSRFTSSGLYYDGFCYISDRLYLDDFRLYFPWRQI